MSEFGVIAAILGAVLIGAISPGPSFVMVLRTSIALSRPDGLAAAVGMGLGGALFGTAALLGLTALLAQVEWLYVVLKLAGGAYLIYLAVRVWRGARQPLAIPATAVLSAPYGDSVFVVETKVEGGVTNQAVQQKFIRTGRALGDFIQVETGLQAGDRVVTAGIFKLRNGMAVQENNDIAPKPSTTPTPPNT